MTDQMLFRRTLTMVMVFSPGSVSSPSRFNTRACIAPHLFFGVTVQKSYTHPRNPRTAFASDTLARRIRQRASEAGQHVLRGRRRAPRSGQFHELLDKRFVLSDREVAVDNVDETLSGQDGYARRHVIL